MPTTRSRMTLEAIEELIAQRVAEALATYEANRNIENIVKSGDENNNGNGGGNGDENANNNNRSGNHDENARGAMKAARECTYKEFLNCQPLNFKGTKGAVSLERDPEDGEWAMEPNYEEEKIERRYVQLLQGMLTAKESRKMSRKEIIANNKIRGNKWVRYTLLELVARQAMLELYHSVTSASFITTVHVPLNVETIRKSATKQETVEPLPR
ncbi:hypothetical protein Tco_1501486 [Tanacetum coccineum]